MCVCGHIFLSLRSVHILISMFPACIDQGLITTTPIWCLLSRCKSEIEAERKKPNEKAQGYSRMKEYVSVKHTVLLYKCFSHVRFKHFFYGNSWIVNVSDQKYVQVTRISVCTRGTSGRRWPFFDQILTCPCRGASQWCRLLSDSYFLIPRLKAKISSAEQRVAFISGVSVFTSPDSLSAVSKIRCE